MHEIRAIGRKSYGTRGLSYMEIKYYILFPEILGLYRVNVSGFALSRVLEIA